MEQLRGKYRFFLDGKLVHEQENALTTMGRSIAIKSLLGIIPNFANAISYGIGSKANTVDPNTNLITDNSLQFEIGRTSVIGSSLQTTSTNDSLIYSGVIQDSAEYSIYEVGLFPSTANNIFLGVRASTILSFNEVNVFTQVGTASGAFMSANSSTRIGTDMMFVPQLDGTTNYLQYSTASDEIDYLDTYAAQDIFRLAGFNPGNSSSSVIFRFYADDTNYYQVLFNTPSASGYFIVDTPKYDAAIIGSPKWDNINYLRFWQTSASGIFLDGIRINTGSYLFDTNTGMISRAVLSSPVRKPASIPLTIEYTLNIGFNEGF